jgi:hypothetical protein
MAVWSFHFLPCYLAISAKQHGRIWKYVRRLFWAQNRLGVQGNPLQIPLVIETAA